MEALGNLYLVAGLELFLPERLISLGKIFLYCLGTELASYFYWEEQDGLVLYTIFLQEGVYSKHPVLCLIQPFSLRTVDDAF